MRKAKERKRNYLRRQLSVVCALAASMGFAASADAEPQTLYRETFGYCTGTIGKDAAAEANWVGLVSGLPQAKISNLKVFSYGTLDIGGSVNSNPLGLAQGYSFWFKPVYGLSLITAEFPFDVGIIKNSQALIEYKQRLSGVDAAGTPNKTHLAFLIDSTWYISSAFVRQQRPGVWESVQFEPASLTYGTVPYVDGLGPVVPSEFGAPLPAAGTVRAFGVFLDEVNGRVRLDNFVIKGIMPSDGSISGDVQEPDVSLCPASSPDRNGGGAGPTPPPDEDDGDDSTDRFQPDPVPSPTPAPVDVHGAVYQFCPVKQQGTGRRVVVSSKARAAIMKNVSGTTLADLRERAMISLLARKSMPIGSVVNVKRGDFDAANGVISMSVRRSAKPARLRLRGAALTAMQRYLEHPTAPGDVTAPLFVDVGASTHAMHVSVQRALCLADVRTMLKARAKQAKVAIPLVAQTRKK